MGNNDHEQISLSIVNAIRSLYRMILLIDEDVHSCRIIDYDKEVYNLCVDNVKSFDELCERIYKNIHPQDRELFSILTDTRRIHDELSVKVSISEECRIRHSDFKYYWTKITICNAKYEDSPQGKEYLLLLEDIHQLKNKEKTELGELMQTLSRLKGDYAELFTENMTDQLTGCYNRKGFVYFENQVITDAKRNNKAVFVCVLDLNGLKYINDTYGHKAGDEAIMAVSDTLKKSSPEGSKIIRTGGDEFLILAVIDKDADIVPKFSSDVKTGLQKYNEEHQNEFEVNASFGTVVVEDVTGTGALDKYIEIADQRMYEMKDISDLHKR